MSRTTDHCHLPTYRPSRAPFWRAATACVALMVGAGATLGAADKKKRETDADAPDAPPVGAVHVLDAIEVSAYADNLPWIYAQANGTEILSLCSDAATRAFMMILRGRNALLNDTLPAQLRGELAAPAVVVLYDADDIDAMRRGEMRRQYVLLENGSALSRRRPPSTPQTAWASDRDQAVFSANLRYGPPHDQTLSRRWPYSVTTALRFVLDRQYPQLPPWLLEGLDGHLRECTWLERDRSFALAPLPWISPEATKALLKNPKQVGHLLPLAEFFASGLGEHPRGEDETYSIYEVQSALFVRWAMEGDGRSRRDAFWEFAMRAADEPVTEGLFEEYFGMSFNAAEERLRAYLPTAVRTDVTVQLPRSWRSGSMMLRTATEDEIGRLRAEWERVVARGNPQDSVVRKDGLARARESSRRAFELGQGDPRVIALRGLIAADAGDADTARTFLEEAARADVARPAVYVELARLRLRYALENPGSPFGTISAGQLKSVLELLASARTRLPLMPDVYLLMAEACAQSAALPDRQYLGMLAEGARLFPRNSELVCRVAELHAANGLRADATEMVEHTLALGPDPAARERLTSLQASLQESVPFRLRATASTREQ